MPRRSHHALDLVHELLSRPASVIFVVMFVWTPEEIEYHLLRGYSLLPEFDLAFEPDS